MSENLSPEDLKGMTVNERLYHLGLFNEYDQAIESQDIEKLRIVLTQLHIGSENIEEIIKTKLSSAE